MLSEMNASNSFDAPGIMPRSIKFKRFTIASIHNKVNGLIGEGVATSVMGNGKQVGQ